MKIIAMVNGGFAIPTLHAIKNSEHEIVAVVAMPIRTRGSKSSVPPIRRAVEEFLSNVPLYDPENINSDEGISIVRSLNADLIFICDYGKILSREVLSLTKYGGLNLHGSLLPQYRGAAPINRAIQAGERTLGVSVIFIEPQVDAGPIVATDSYEPSINDTALEIEDYLANLGAPLVIDSINRIEKGTIKPLPQIHDHATQAPKIRKEDGRIDWSKPSYAIINQYRAFQPWPKTYSDWTNSANGKVIRLILGPFRPYENKIIDFNVSEKTSIVQPGTVISASQEGLCIKTGDGALRVVNIQAAGKKNICAEAFLRGYPVKVGDVLR